MENFPFKEETYKIIGLCMEVQKHLALDFLKPYIRMQCWLSFVIIIFQIPKS